MLAKIIVVQLQQPFANVRAQPNDRLVNQFIRPQDRAAFHLPFFLLSSLAAGSSRMNVALG